MNKTQKLIKMRVVPMLYFGRFDFFMKVFHRHCEDFFLLLFFPPLSVSFNIWIILAHSPLDYFCFARAHSNTKWYNWKFVNGRYSYLFTWNFSIMGVYCNPSIHTSSFGYTITGPLNHHRNRNDQPDCIQPSFVHTRFRFWRLRLPLTRD